jgi:FKBP-type peptidyl-prolyl cis-trans isomerase FklB
MNIKAIALTVLASAAIMNLRADGTNSFPDEKSKVSYAIGMNVGTNLKRRDIEIDVDQFMEGVKNSIGIGTAKMTDQEVSEALSQFGQQMMAKQQEKMRRQGETNKAAGQAFLEANKSKPGVITTTNGLQYKVITEGSGDSPGPEDTVTVNYRGTLIDGTEFDSSEKAGHPVTLRVNGVIRGWTEALTQMKPGAKWQLFIPSDLAYGERGSPPRIGPNSALIFDVELVSVQKPKPPQPLTSDIIKVPSLEEMKKGAKIETIKASDVEKLQKEAQTNSAAR